MPPGRRSTARDLSAQSPPLDRAGMLILVALGLTLLTGTVAAVRASNWLWGFDALVSWPRLSAAAVLVLALSGLIPRVAHAIEGILAPVGATWQRSGRLADAAVSALASGLLLIAHDPLCYTGDFALRLGVIRMVRESAQLLEHVYPLDRWINFTIPRALVQQGLSEGVALQTVGAVAGGVFVFVGLRFLRASGARGSALPAGAMVLFTGPLLIHFAGYDKFGPLMIGILLAALGSLRLARAGGGLWTAVAGSAIGVYSHRSAYLLVPALGYILAQAFRTARGRPAKMRVMAAIFVAALAYVLMLSRSLDMILHFDRSVHLPGGTVAESRAGGGAPFPQRLAQSINVISFLVPLWGLGVAALLGSSRAERENPGPARHTHSRFSLVPAVGLALGGLALVPFGVEPGGGWVRDWDVGTGFGTLLAGVTAYAVVDAWERAGARATLAPIVSLALATGVAYWGLHVNEGLAIRRIEALLVAPPHWSDATRAQTYDFFGVRAINAGRADRAANDFDQAIAMAGPNPRLFYEAGLASYQCRQYGRARDRFRRAAALSPRNAEAWTGLAYVDLATGDTTGAVADIDSALAREPSRADARSLAGAIAAARRR